MFDIGFTELLIIGVVALLVVGPERLPKVARTAGHLLGRFQRYVSSVKSDISREVQLEELRKAGQSFKESVESTALGIQNRVEDTEYTIREEVVSPAEKVIKAMAATEGPNPVTEAEMERIRQEQEVAAAAQPTEQTEIAFEENNPASANKPDKS
jgi:sec-independent protein translocase protein TatB